MVCVQCVYIAGWCFFFWTVGRGPTSPCKIIRLELSATTIPSSSSPLQIAFPRRCPVTLFSNTKKVTATMGNNTAATWAVRMCAAETPRWFESIWDLANLKTSHDDTPNERINVKTLDRSHNHETWVAVPRSPHRIPAFFPQNFPKIRPQTS